jgi:hypothetical protein
MYIYLFKDGRLEEEIALSNHNHVQIAIYLEELIEKNGIGTEMFLTEKKYNNPQIKDLG